MYSMSLMKVKLENAKIDMVKAGVCLSTGTVLSNEQLVANTVSSFVHGLIDKDIVLNSETWRGSYRIGVIYGKRAINFANKVNKSYNNMLNTERNFGAIVLYDGNHAPNYSLLKPKRPVTVISISKDGFGNSLGGGGVRFYDFRRLELYRGG